MTRRIAKNAVINVKHAKIQKIIALLVWLIGKMHLLAIALKITMTITH